MTQTAPSPNAITDATVGTGMRAITAFVNGSRRVTVLVGPLATQTEP